MPVMRIEAIQATGSYRSKSVWNCGKVAFCCEEMGQAWQKQVGFGEWNSCGLNIVPAACLYYVHCWPEGAAADEVQIAFCPFCGAAIEVEERLLTAPAR